MLPPPRRGSDSMEIVCKLRHTRGVMPSGGFRHPLRKREGDKKTTTHLKSYGYNLPVGTANLGVGDLGCAPVGTRKGQDSLRRSGFCPPFSRKDLSFHSACKLELQVTHSSMAKAQLPFHRPCLLLLATVGTAGMQNRKATT